MCPANGASQIERDRIPNRTDIEKLNAKFARRLRRLELHKSRRGAPRLAVAGRHVVFRGDDNAIAIPDLAGNGDACAPPFDHEDNWRDNR
jgi:hypothetical protein